ncbi:flagellar hook protein FlgE [Thiohalobacter sp. IOR34]|uniref:flagellar hook protein FlgE n=1 Tax=Thiohalobacter sp. IOR34 TaxID=3057176 RepID=UPI0025B0D774|nr:flagellar hook protein FlgE [Thiohalobacter sp. IOR34]WJW74611.1 flagellar hook protein FlgE [Thiohalobacter sp. IOR34]
MPFRIALSGLNAASSDLQVTGNNIANSGTAGFKSSRSEFADVYATSLGGVSNTAVGGGVRLARVAQQFSQGNIEFTSNNLDLAVNGEGFFILSDSGSLQYTRAGAFSVDRDGYVVNSSGQRLQIFSPIGNSSTNFDTGSLQDLQISLSEGSPSATVDVDLAINLDASDTSAGASASSTAAAIAAFDPDTATTYDYSTSFTVYDSLGSQHTATSYYLKDPNTANTWYSWLYVDDGSGTAQRVDFNSGSDEYATLVFDTDGTLDTSSSSGSSGVVSYDSLSLSSTTGAAALALDLDYNDLTQFGGDFAVNSLSQDGYATGRLTGLDIADNGVVSARYTNGQSTALGKIALANFPNNQGLRQLGDTNWAQTYSSGDRLVGEAGTASFGLIQSGALESSNVDIAEQLINLITAQRNFQANSQVISTADTITQTIINIR